MSINQEDKSADDVKRDMRQQAESVKREGTAAAKDRAESGKEQAAGQLQGLSEAIDKAASSLSEQDKDGLAAYVHQSSTQLSSLATRLQERSIDQLADDAKRLAHKNPAMFVIGSVAIGFGLTRFLKASRPGAGSYSDHRQVNPSAASPYSPGTGSSMAEPVNPNPLTPGTTGTGSGTGTAPGTGMPNRGF